MFPFLLVLLSAAGLASAQIPYQFFRGEVYDASIRGGILAGNLSVEVHDPATHLVIERAPVSPSGTFEFRYAGKAPDLDLRLVNERGEILRSERIVRPEPGLPLRLSLNEKRPTRPPSGIVSLRGLQHQPLKAARKEYDRAQRAFTHHDLESAALHLRNATRIDPQFLEAYNNLGARLLELHRHAEAAEALEHAVALDPAESRPMVNLAIVQLHLGKFTDAERTARAASKLQRDTHHAEYVLGLSLLAQKKNLPESLSLLERACDELPHALVAAGQILMFQGRMKEAEDHFVRYLATNPTGQPRQLAETWLASVRTGKAWAPMAN